MPQFSDPGHLLLSVLFFPTFFQNSLLAWAAGSGDPWGLMLAKRLLLLLPVSGVLLGLWASILCLVTVIVRQKRREFAVGLVLTWWDLGKAVFSFWGGLLSLLVVFPGALLGLVKNLLVFLWLFLQDVLMLPLRLVRGVGRSFSNPGLPWIAFLFTIFWCVLEAVIFTYVMTPLVMDTLSNMTGTELSETVVRVPLFLFLLFLIMGSYAVLNTWGEALASRNVGAIIRITAIEMVAMLVEVLFLYREFVDSLIPWFAQYGQGNFNLGMGAILVIAFLIWLGVRGMTWFLFAGHGTPTLLAIIQGQGLRGPTPAGAPGPAKPIAEPSEASSYVEAWYQRLVKDQDWVKEKGQEVLGAFILPPLQVLAAGLNFLTLLVTAQHLFEVPIPSLRDLLEHRPHLMDPGTLASRKAPVVKDLHEAKVMP